MAKKSVIMPLPIQPFNQNKHSDVCQYLEYLENFLLEVFTPANEPPVPPDASPADIASRKDRILSEVKVPLCGDLLGRERVTGAKQTRMGCDYKTERFENIVENVAQWHTKQSFLGVRIQHNENIAHILIIIGGERVQGGAHPSP